MKLCRCAESHTLYTDAEPTVVLLRKCVGVDDIKFAQFRKLIAGEYILPLASENPDVRLFMPSLFFHMSEYIGVCLDDDMERGWFGEGLKHGVDLDKCQTSWGGQKQDRRQTIPRPNPTLRTLRPVSSFGWLEQSSSTVFRTRYDRMQHARCWADRWTTY